jgi:hypothetical protein
MGCEYRGGRAESAPLTRTTQSGKVTLADANLDAYTPATAVSALYEVAPSTAATREGTQGEWGTKAIMPHLEFSGQKLDEEYPSIIAPKEIDDSHEVDWDTWDKVLARGMEIVEEIKETMRVQGRRRCERPLNTTATPRLTTTATTQPQPSRPLPPPSPQRPTQHRAVSLDK